MNVYIYTYGNIYTSIYTYLRLTLELSFLPLQRLYARRATAYAKAGCLHRAVADLHQAMELVGDNSDPSAVSDTQMLQVIYK